MQDPLPPRTLVRGIFVSTAKIRRAPYLVLALIALLVANTGLAAFTPLRALGAAPAAVTPTPTLALGQHFTDVPPGDGFYSAITWGSDQHLFGGYANGDGTYSFHSGSEATRAQVAKMLVSAEGWATDTSGGPHFADVPPTSVLYPMVETAYQHGIANGYPCGAPAEPCPGLYFRPGNAITRAQFAKMLVLARNWPLDTSVPEVFADVAPDSIFYGAVQTAHDRGAIGGYTCGAAGEPCPGAYYRPARVISRAQVAKLLYVAYNPGSVATPLATPAATSIYWGGYISGATYDPTWGDAPWDARTLAAFESHAGKAVSIIHFGQAWQAGSGAMNAFDVGPFNLTRAHGAIPLINWNPWQYCCGANQPNWRLSNIINGQYDSYITQWASAAHAWGHPFFLRIMDEMNGTWYPWSEGANGNQPGQYVLAWRHIHNLFAAAGATNAIWVWNPNTEYSGSLPLEGLYPGDPYVDWVGMTGYNFGPTNRGDVWTSFSALMGPLYTHLGTIAPGKPVMIGETASTETGGSKAAWISDALATQIPTAFPRVRAVVWFNWTAEGYDWMVETSSTAQTAFAQGIASPYYATNQFGNLNQAP